MKMLTGMDARTGEQVTIKPGQRFTLEKRHWIAYELQKDGSHKRVSKKPTGRARRLARQQRRAEAIYVDSKKVGR